MMLSYSKKEPKAKEFEYDLIAEIYANYEMHPLWLQYRDQIKLPEHDYENVVFEGNAFEGDYKKLKDFIEDFEHKLYSPSTNVHY